MRIASAAVVLIDGVGLSESRSHIRIMRLSTLGPLQDSWFRSLANMSYIYGYAWGYYVASPVALPVALLNSLPIHTRASP